MPGERLLMLAENLLLDAQFVGRLLVADQEASGLTVDRVANGRRHPGDRWSPTTANADHTIKLTCDELRAANCFVIDRASNHLGKRFILESSSDDFVTARTIFDVTIPLVVGGQPIDALGCVTDEGAWIKTFTAEASYAYRLTSKAMGAGIVPQVTGIWLGLAWAPSNFLINFPVHDETSQITMQATRSPVGWRGRTRPGIVRMGEITIEPGDETDYDQIRYQVGPEGIMSRGFPAWLIHDRIAGGRNAILVALPDTARLDFGVTKWPFRKLTIPFEEEQPLP